ncbi:short-subunit dehydrogenase [Eilatimonas milleporae]|uniref:Short-subunit dehydrogenase n=2 Tax=Eilatimonas milleporae TaxID=911205 RepID=A0A3M0CWT6_9PROT|nr:SDR family oxidoreductase [Eilatimonas milleporae]RMB11826.1 short-subunit dehydrogenase [Eilatimonas milleporae]
MMTNGDTVWITGASSGIGEALALEFASRGTPLILSARREDELARVKNLCVERGTEANAVMILPLDVTNETALPDIVQTAKAFTGRIDMLINNAGISQRALCIDTDMATYRRLFEVDVFGQIALTKAVLPIMLEQESGHLAVTASVAGKVGAPQRTGYCAAKHAMMGFFDALRAEVAHRGIKVTTITPGFIRTAISQNALKGDGSRFGQTDNNIAGGMDVGDCARVIMRGFDKGTPEIPVGKGAEMHALWIKRFFPRLMFKVASRIGQAEQ